MLQATVCSKVCKKLYWVYFLNVVDFICTIALLSTGFFYEANPIARTFIQSSLLGVLIKCAIPFLVIVLCAKGMSVLDYPQLKVADKVVSFGLTVYLVILLDHLINFIILVTV